MDEEAEDCVPSVAGEIFVCVSGEKRKEEKESPKMRDKTGE
jgi:hypothetical protein